MGDHASAQSLPTQIPTHLGAEGLTAWRLPPIHLRRDPIIHRQRTIEGTRAAVRKRRKRGRAVGAPRFGTRVTSDGLNAPDEREGAAITLMLELDAQGCTLAEIAAALEAAGFRSRRGNVLTGKRISERLRAQIVPSRDRTAPIPSSDEAQTPCPCCGKLHA